MSTRHSLMLSAAAAASAASVLLGATPALAVTPEVETFSDPFDGGFSCDGFDAVFEGHDRGRITNFFDQDGVFTNQVGHIHAVETDTNLRTGKSVVVRTNITVHGELDPSGQLVTWSITGQFNVGTAPGSGIVLHDTGRVEFDHGVPFVFHGVHDTFTKGEQAFCDALG